MPCTVTGTYAGQKYKFRINEIKRFICDRNASPERLQEVADILAANTEVPEIEEDGTVEIDRRNFNDSFRDMEADLSGIDDDDEDD